jgi:predicted RNase H-like HicB family nuclease
MRKIRMIVEQTATGFSAYAESLPVFTAGDNLTDLKANILEALSLHFDENNEPPITAQEIELVFMNEVSLVWV